MFVDERVERGDALHRFIVSCVVCSRRSWAAAHNEAARIGALRPARRLKEIAELLDRLQGFALLAYADLPAALLPTGEVDGVDDIPRMTRADNIWSQTVLAAAASVLGCLRTGGVAAADIDLYYDPKSLTLAHRAAFEKTLRQALPEIAKEDPATGATQSSRTFTLERIEQVPKRQGDVESGPLEHGTFLAHQLCVRADELIRGRKVHRVVVRDHSDALRHMVVKFTPQGECDELA